MKKYALLAFGAIGYIALTGLCCWGVVWAGNQNSYLSSVVFITLAVLFLIGPPAWLIDKRRDLRLGRFFSQRHCPSCGEPYRIERIYHHPSVSIWTAHVLLKPVQENSSVSSGPPLCCPESGFLICCEYCGHEARYAENGNVVEWMDQEWAQ